MGRSLKILGALGVAALLAYAVDRTVLAPQRLIRALDALPRTTLAEALAPIETLDRLVLLDDRDGWFLVEEPKAHGALEVGRQTVRLGEVLLGGRHVPLYCGSDRGRVLWGIEDAQIVREYAYCNKARMDLRSLRIVAKPIAMERDQLIREDVEALLADLANDPSRVPITFPAEMSPFPYERVVVLPWIWATGPDDPHQNEAERLAWDRIDAVLKEHEGAYDISFSTGPSAPLTQAESGGATGALVRTGSRPSILPGVINLSRPMFTVRCTAEACAALDLLDMTGALDPWRNPDTLAAAIAAAEPISGDINATGLPDAEDIESDGLAIGPAIAPVYAVRVGRLLAGP